jgi:hypothetical protein
MTSHQTHDFLHSLRRPLTCLEMVVRDSPIPFNSTKIHFARVILHASPDDSSSIQTLAAGIRTARQACPETRESLGVFSGVGASGGAADGASAGGHGSVSLFRRTKAPGRDTPSERTLSPPCSPRGPDEPGFRLVLGQRCHHDVNCSSSTARSSTPARTDASAHAAAINARSDPRAAMICRPAGRRWPGNGRLMAARSK